VEDAALIETVFVLEKLKKIRRNTIAQAFVDCYLEALARRNGAAPLYTFDHKLASQLSGAQLLSP